MKKKYCPLEREISSKIKDGKPDNVVEKHIRECSICRETALVVTWMNIYPAEKARQAAAGKLLPESDFLLRAAHKKKEKDISSIKKALRPIRTAQAIGMITLVGSVCALAFSLFSGRGFFADSLLRQNLLDGIGMFVAANPLALFMLVVFSFFLLISELKLIRS